MAYSYERRNELARTKGFASYSEYRRATEFANRHDDFVRHVGGTAGGTRADNLDIARLYYQAFKLGDKDDYSIQTRNGKPIVRMVNGKPKGAKAKWLIDVAGYVNDAEEWKRRYPAGHRGRE